MCLLNFLIACGYGVLGQGRKALGGIITVLLSVMLLSGPITAQPVTIAALGDSLTQGYGLPAPDGFVPQLGAALAAAGHKVELINAGVSGDTTAGGLARMDWTLEPRVQGLIVTLGGNDLLRGLDPKVSRGNLRGILVKAAEKDVQVLLVGMQAPLNFGPAYKAEFEASYADLATEFGTLYYPDFMAGLAAEGSLTAVQDLMQRDGIHPNAAGVALIVADILPGVVELIERINVQ